MADADYLDWPFFDDSHRDLAGGIRGWAAAHAGGDHGDDVDGTCRGLVAGLGADGWLRHAVPDEGDRHDVRSIALIREALAYQDGLADFAFVMQGLGTAAVHRFGTPAQRDAILGGARDGTAIAALAMTEPQSGSDVANIQATARRTDGGYVLDGTKRYISNAGLADFYLVLARTGEAPGAKGLSMLLVPADAPGLSLGTRHAVMAPHPLGDIEFRNCQVPDDAVIGVAGDGFKIAMSVLDSFRASVGAAALGFARRALDETLAWSEQRQMFGGRQNDLQLVQAAIGDMATAIDAAALLVYRAAWRHDTGAARVTREASMAKLFATEAAQQVVDTAVQLHGGAGVIAGNVVERLYREVRALRIYEGASEVQRLIVGGQVLRAARDTANGD